MNLLNDDDLMALVHSAEKQGFIFKKLSKHFCLIPPDKSKPIVTIGGTSSNRRQEFWTLRTRLKQSGWKEDVNIFNAKKKGK